MKFQLSPATGCAGSYMKETSVGGRGGGLQAALCLAKGSTEEYGGLEATPTSNLQPISGQVLGQSRPKPQNIEAEVNATPIKF